MIPKDYREFSDKIATILRSKPKHGYFESILEKGQPEPLDALEELSMVIGKGKKDESINILEAALADKEKIDMLSYLSNAEQRLQALIDEIKALPDIDSSQPTKTKTENKLPLFVVLALALAMGVTAIIYFL